MPILPEELVVAAGVPTANDDETKGYAQGHRWLNTVTSRLYTLIDPTAGAAKWRSGRAWEQYPFTNIQSTSNSWQTIGCFGFLGTDDVGDVMSIKMIGGVVDAGAVCAVRVVDATNVALIASNTSVTDAAPSLIDLSPIQNLPTGPAIFEAQVKRISGSGSKAVEAGTVAFRF